MASFDKIWKACETQEPVVLGKVQVRTYRAPRYSAPLSLTLYPFLQWFIAFCFVFVRIKKTSG